VAGILLVLIIFFLSSHDFIPGERKRKREKEIERERDGRGGGGELAPGERSPVKAFALKLCNLGRKFAFELLGKPRAAV